MPTNSTPLPEVDSPLVQRFAGEEPNSLSAYRVCLGYERDFASSKNDLRHARILGFLLLHVPDRGARQELAKCIHSCKDRGNLTDLGEFFERRLIIPFKKYRGRTPKTSGYHSRPSFEVVKREIEAGIAEAPKDHKDAKCRALIRDNWRCVATGIIDKTAPDYIKATLDPGTTGVYTECAHIIPEATYFGLDDKAKRDYSASILAVFKRFRYDITEFNGPKVHSLFNVMSLEKNVHEGFDRLEIYFEATLQKNHYEVKWYGLKPPTIREFVTFSTSDPENLPVPSPELLALHATCCKVAHLSGASEYIDEIYRDAETMGVLSADGASGDMLGYALLSLSNHTVGVQG